MIRSMTAFARQDEQAEWGALTCEIRSVNHRYLEPHFRLPDSLRDLETTFRERLRQQLGRGKVEISLRLDESASSGGNLRIDEDLSRAIVSAAEKIADQMHEPTRANPMDVLRWPGVVQQQSPETDTIRAAATQVFDAALADLISAREREGQQLVPLFEERLSAITDQVQLVRQRLPEILDAQRRQLRARIEEVVNTVDEDRLAQELVTVAQKADVAEELDRLDAHVKEVRDALSQRKPVGRRLDFLMQELNREANTLSSKSLSADVTTAAVELKVLIEQIREQVQNVE